MKKLLVFCLLAPVSARQAPDSVMRIGSLKNGIRQAGNDSFVVINSKNGGTETFIFVERMATPSYDLNRFLADNIRYPDSARIKGQEGKVVVQVIISESGAITEPKVIRTASPLLDAEALRVVKLMPDWKPAYRNGAPCHVYYSIPVIFKL